MDDGETVFKTEHNEVRHTTQWTCGRFAMNSNEEENSQQ
jgi:hypothetical protein